MVLNAKDFWFWYIKEKKKVATVDELDGDNIP